MSLKLGAVSVLTIHKFCGSFAQFGWKDFLSCGLHRALMAGTGRAIRRNPAGKREIIFTSDAIQADEANLRWERVSHAVCRLLDLS